MMIQTLSALLAAGMADVHSNLDRAFGPVEPAPKASCDALSIGEYFDDLADAEMIDDLADVGALPRGYPGMPRGYRGRPAARGGYGRQLMPAKAMAARRLIPMVPGAPAVGIRLQPLGFPVRTFGAATGTALTATTRPQRPFKGKRLIVDIARTGASATGLVTITQLSVGSVNQWVSSDPVGAGSFAPGAFDANVELAACTAALDISVFYSVSTAPAMTDVIDIGTTLFGETVG